MHMEKGRRDSELPSEWLQSECTHVTSPQIWEQNVTSTSEGPLTFLSTLFFTSSATTILRSDLIDKLWMVGTSSVAFTAIYTTHAWSKLAEWIKTILEVKPAQLM